MDPLTELEPIARYIPVVLTINDGITQTSTKAMVNFEDTQLSYQLDVPIEISDKFWILVENNASFYRVDYSDQLMKRITEALSTPGLINDYDKIAMFNDIFQIVSSGRRGPGDLIRFMKTLHNSVDNYFILRKLTNAYLYLKMLFNNTDKRKIIDQFANDLFIDIFRRTKDLVETDNKDLIRRHSLSFVYSLLVYLNNPEVIKWSRNNSFEKSWKHLASLDPVHQGAHLTYLSRCESEVCHIYFDELLKNFTPNLFDGYVFGKSIGLSNKPDRIKSAWEIVFKHNTHNLLSYLRTLVNTSEGLEFLGYLLQNGRLIGTISRHNIKRMLRKFCVMDQNHPMCSNAEFIKGKFGERCWHDIEKAKVKQDTSNRISFEELFALIYDDQ